MTALEEMLLDELRHVLVVLRDRMITPRNYMKFVGDIQARIREAEETIARHDSSGR